MAADKAVSPAKMQMRLVIMIPHLLGCSNVTIAAGNTSGQLRVVCPEKSRPTPIEGGLNVDSSFNTLLVD